MAEDSDRHWTVVVTYSLTAPGSVTDAKVFEEFYAAPELPPGWETAVTRRRSGAGGRGDQALTPRLTCWARW